MPSRLNQVYRNSKIFRLIDCDWLVLPSVVPQTRYFETAATRASLPISTNGDDHSHSGCLSTSITVLTMDISKIELRPCCSLHFLDQIPSA